MVVVRGKTLYDLETVPVAPDGVAALAGEPVPDDEPVRRQLEARVRRSGRARHARGPEFAYTFNRFLGHLYIVRGLPRRSR